jgi:protein-disulfide isomerase
MRLSLGPIGGLFRGLFPAAFVAGLLIASPAQAQQLREFSLNGLGHFLGSSDAPVLVVEFADFGCPNCARFNADIFPRIESGYINRKIVRWKVIPWASNNFPNSREAAAAAECAAEQGAFWKMHDHLYLMRVQWMKSNDVKALLAGYAARLKLDRGQFVLCQEKPEILDRISRLDAIARGLNLRGTPMFFVNGRLVQGVVPYEMFQQIIQEAR